MQTLWAKILAGEVTNPGSTSIRTLSILKNLKSGCSRPLRKVLLPMCLLRTEDRQAFDARAPFLGDYKEGNALQTYGIDYGSLNLLNEHGLIVSDYNSWRDYNGLYHLLAR